MMWELLVPNAAAYCGQGMATTEIAAPTFPHSCPFNYAVLSLACMANNPDDRPPMLQVQEVLQALDAEVTRGLTYLDCTGSQRVCPPRHAHRL
jgi:hypothetical protein